MIKRSIMSYLKGGGEAWKLKGKDWLIQRNLSLVPFPLLKASQSCLSLCTRNTSSKSIIIISQNPPTKPPTK